MSSYLLAAPELFPQTLHFVECFPSFGSGDFNAYESLGTRFRTGFKQASMWKALTFRVFQAPHGNIVNQSDGDSHGEGSSAGGN